MTPRSDTPQRLLERAIEVLDEQGESGIKLREIAEHCGVTTPIVYRHFGNREELIIAAHAERYLRTWQQITDPDVLELADCTTVEQVREVLNRILDDTFLPERHVRRTTRREILGASVNRPALQTAINGAHNRIRIQIGEAIRTLQARGLMRADIDADAAVLWYTGQIDGRGIVEMAEDAGWVDLEAWNRVCRQATLFMMLGDTTV